MINGVHTMFYTSEPEELRIFFRDKLGFPATDTGGGWLIFDLPPAEMGCHPENAQKGAISGTHDISFHCDNLDQTMAELQAKGVKFVGDIQEEEYGRVIHFEVPGGFRLQLYQPKY